MAVTFEYAVDSCTQSMLSDLLNDAADLGWEPINFHYYEDTEFDDEARGWRDVVMVDVTFKRPIIKEN